MKNRLLPVLLLLATISAVPAYGESIRIVADEFPPYNYIEKGKITGIGTDIIRALLKETGIGENIRILPWARAYKIALEDDNIMIYTIARSPERENLFKWVGVVAKNNLCLFSLKDRDDIYIQHLNDAMKYNIGGVREDVRTQYLLSQGFTKIDQVSKNRINLAMLMNRRIDLWLEDELTAYYLLKKNGYDTNNPVKKVYQFQTGYDGYIAFGRNTPEELVEKFRKAYQEIKSNGIYDAIIQKYRIQN